MTFQVARRDEPVAIDGTIDIECAEWDRFVVGALYQPDRGATIFRSLPALVDELGRRGGQWWAHNGGLYDALAIADELGRRGARVAYHPSGARISRLVGGGFVVRDSWQIVPMGLDAAAELAGLAPPGDLGWPCRCGAACGGYCSITPSLSAARARHLSDYCARDAEILYRVLVAVRELAAARGIVLRGTLGQTAWQDARRRCELPDQSLPAAIWHRVRSAYYGGRVIVARTHAPRGDQYDIVAAYPHELATRALPIGAWSEVGRPIAARALARRRPGIYRATVTIPGDSWVPPLPARYGDRIGYPTGEVTGVWTLPELEAAASRGAWIGKISHAIVWEDEAPALAPAAEAWLAARAAAGRDTAAGEWWRMLANSCTGKLAERPERYFVRHNPDYIRICLRDRGCADGPCSCGAYEAIDLHGSLWRVPCYRPAPSSHVQWGAYVTAGARLAQLAGLEAAGELLVYGDTDSRFACAGAPPPGKVGQAPGQWRHVGAWRDFAAIGPKSYRFTADPLPRPTLRVAGVRDLTLQEWGDLERGLRIERDGRGVKTLLEAGAAGGALFARRGKMVRRGERIREWYGDRRLDPKTGITYPASDVDLARRWIPRRDQGRQEARAPAQGTRSQGREAVGARSLVACSVGRFPGRDGTP